MQLCQSIYELNSQNAQLQKPYHFFSDFFEERNPSAFLPQGPSDTGYWYTTSHSLFNDLSLQIINVMVLEKSLWGVCLLRCY